MRSTKAVLFVLFVLLFTTYSAAQTAGKIFSKEEADKLFGPVIESVKLNVADFKDAVSKTEKNIMFRVSFNEAKILGDERKAIYPTTDFAVGKDDVYHLYSKSVVLDLLSKGKGDVVYLENRKEVFSVTFGDYTMEMAVPCPPICVE